MAGRPVLVIERIFEPPFRSTLPYFLLGEGGEKRRVITSIEPAAIPTFPREKKAGQLLFRIFFSAPASVSR